MIQGRKLKRPIKQDLADAIAAELAIGSPNVSAGSSVDSTFLDSIHARITGGPSGGVDTYRKTERLLLRLGRTYDPYWDTSESHGATGGGTVTARAYSQVLAAIAGVDRCFLVPARSSAIIDGEFRLDASPRAPKGIQAFLDAGPGSRLLLFGVIDDYTPASVVASASITYVASGWDGPWTVSLGDVRPFQAPVPLNLIEIDGWSRGAEIVEIDPATYEDIVLEAASGEARTPARDIETAGANAVAAPLDDMVEPLVDDPGGAAIAARILEDYPAINSVPEVEIPTDLPVGQIHPAEVRTPNYSESDEGVVIVGAAGFVPRSKNPRRDKLAEERAIQLAINALEAAGWTLSADRQRDGVGYDLEFTKKTRVLHAEVKGIQGSNLAFNVTPKEFWRAQTDERWVAVAVTRVLSPVDFEVHLVTRDRVVSANRLITGFRITL